MVRRTPQVQAAALRLAAERIERGGSLEPALAEALEDDLNHHPEELEELAGFEASEGPVPEWMRDELDRREASDSGGELASVVMARVLAQLKGQRRSA